MAALHPHEVVSAPTAWPRAGNSSKRTSGRPRRGWCWRRSRATRQAFAHLANGLWVVAPIRLVTGKSAAAEPHARAQNSYKSVDLLGEPGERLFPYLRLFQRSDLQRVDDAVPSATLYSLAVPPSSSMTPPHSCTTACMT